MRQVTLEEARDEGGYRRRWVTLTDNGAVRIEGQDLGRGVERFFGEGLTGIPSQFWNRIGE